VTYENKLEANPVGNGRRRVAGVSRNGEGAIASDPTSVPPNDSGGWDGHGYHSNPACWEQRFHERRPQVATVCHDGGAVLIAFQNIGSERATLNFLFSDGTTVTASGLILAPGREFQALYNNKRIEGQFIFANTAGNTTVSLHAFDGGIFCETRGTVQFGPNPPPPPVNAPPEVSR
jgi:hypothetical protein